MKSRGPFCARIPAIPALVLFLMASFSLAACGGSGSGGTSPNANTQVVLLLTSTANDQLVEFNVLLSTIALTDQSGNTITIYTNPLSFGPGPDWIHLNGASEPLLTASVPQGTYVSAQVTTFGCAFTNIFDNNGLTTATWDEGLCGEGTGATTVTLPAPIVVSGNAMALSLNLQVSQSYTLASNTGNSYTIDPNFTLTPVPISAAPTNETNGLVSGFDAQIQTVNSSNNTFTMLVDNGATITVKTSTVTVFQGINAFTELAAFQTADVDFAIQSDGSFLATRVEVDNASTQLASDSWLISSNVPANTAGTISDNPIGCGITMLYECAGLVQFDQNTIYGYSGQFGNVASLPFPATIDQNTWTTGQYTAQTLTLGSGNQNYPFAQTNRLIPQTFNGTVESITNQNGFAVYTVALSSYNLFAVTQQGMFVPVPVTDPTTVVVYVDTSAQFLNSGMVEEGNLLRFRGIVFNDNGALRMDCNEILDGVTQ
jgi:hypothetical protein